MRADPDFAAVYYNLGFLFLVTERPEEAKKEFSIAKELFKSQGRVEDVKNVEELLANTWENRIAKGDRPMNLRGKLTELKTSNEGALIAHICVGGTDAIVDSGVNIR